MIFISASHRKNLNVGRCIKTNMTDKVEIKRVQMIDVMRIEYAKKNEIKVSYA